MTIMAIEPDNNMKPLPLIVLTISLIMLGISAYLTAAMIFLLLNISLLIFCIVYLTIKVNYLFIATVLFVLSEFMDKTYFFLAGGTDIDIICGGLLGIAILMNLIILGTGIYRIFKKKEYLANMMYVLLNIMVIISLYFIAHTYILNYNSITGGVFERTPLYFLYIFLTYLSFILIVLVSRKFAYKYKDVKLLY